MSVTRVLIMGAAGRDFHNFNVVFRDHPEYRVVAFTAAQIPNIGGRVYPPALAGSLYPDGIAIYPEDELESLIRTYNIDQVVFSYSDLSHEEVMHRASCVLAAGADFRLLSARRTMLQATKPVVSVCAVRTGAGKSPATRRIASLLREEGLRVAVIRHPMPYGDLTKQAVQRFACLDDLRAADCTIEEREEYEPHIAAGDVVYAGVDYERIIREAASEADVLLWDGGNNDTPFVVPDLEIVLLDPHRAGHELAYFPGEVNLLRAEVLVLTKMDSASAEQIQVVREHIRQFNPKARVLDTTMPVTVDRPDLIKGKRVLVIEDGPTLTHGGMSFGAGVLAATEQGARELVDPRPYAVGTIQETFVQYPHIGNVLPAMGYGATQVRELEETINRVPCDVVLIATPIDLARIISIKQPTCRATYRLEEQGRPGFMDVLQDIIRNAKKG
ncbi:MAG: cyclic 2,3-diphosphoglycerate synthase [Nitrospirae bacterium]|nr:cyclic 2,3-diphosphoglycerate synthase [Nitrospirota bacterium]